VSETAIVLPGGGARGAYQAGVLSRLSEIAPGFYPTVLTGVSAGAINAAFIANHLGSFAEAGRDLRQLWAGLRSDSVLATGGPHMVRNAVRWGVQLAAGGKLGSSSRRGLLDTTPLRGLLEKQLGSGADEFGGVKQNLASGRLRALAVMATSYKTGKAVAFSHLAGDGDRAIWARPYREGRRVELGVDHVMASCALPLLFPPVQVDGEWCGDGSVRQSAPLSPALHLGANRLLVVSTSRPPAAVVDGDDGAPSVARVAGVVVNALMFDSIEYDATYAQRVTDLLLRSSKPHDHLRPVDILVIRPSIDVGALAARFEHTLPAGLRHFTRGWGTLRKNSSDLLATFLFESAYTSELVKLGRADVDARRAEVLRFVSNPTLFPGRDAGA
jgi:NTE family protein